VSFDFDGSKLFGTSWCSCILNLFSVWYVCHEESVNYGGSVLFGRRRTCIDCEVIRPRSGEGSCQGHLGWSNIRFCIWDMDLCPTLHSKQAN